MSFVTDDEKVYEKYDEIWNVVRGLLNLKFTTSPIRDDKCILIYILAHFGLGSIKIDIIKI